MNQARRELVVEKTGKVRQAGATQADGRYIAEVRQTAERDLYTFAVGIIDWWWLSPSLHPQVCRWLTRIPPYRKMLMMPRNHGKSTLIGQAMPLHMFIQSKESNLYFPGQPGVNTRILMVGESEKRATDHLGVIVSQLMGNELLRALWPHVVWDNPRRDARRWNNTEIDLPRKHEYPDPSLRAIGVGTAVVGAHPNCMIKDDLATEDAANYPIIMQRAIDWHVNSRALLEKPDTDLEFIACTRWTVADLPDYIMRNDPSVEVNTRWRGMVENERIIYPEKFGYEGAVEDLRKQFGIMFPLLFFNNVASSDLTDFDPDDLRTFELLGENQLQFEGDIRDERLERDMLHVPVRRVVPDLRGLPLKDTLPMSRHEYLRKVRGDRWSR